MRRPVGVKWVLLFFDWTRFFSRRVATVATLPSALFSERFVALGASWVFSFQPVLPPDYRPLFCLTTEVGQAINAVTGTRLWALLFLSKNVLTLCRRRHRSLVAIAQGFVDFSAHPQTMQQDRQLSRRSNHGSLLSVLPAALGQFQPPPSQIAVRSKRTQNVVRPLHQQRSQIPIAFFADVHLRFTLSRVPSSRLQP